MIEDRINKYYDSLSSTEKDIAKFVMSHKEQCSQLGIVELAIKCHCSKSSVLRMTKKLKFNGYSEFKYSLKRSANPENNIDILTMQEQDIKATLKLFKQINSDEIIDIMYHAERLFFMEQVGHNAMSVLIYHVIYYHKGALPIISQPRQSLLLMYIP